MIRINHARLMLDETLASGQSFAFTPHENGYIGVVDGRALYVCRQEEDLLLDCPADEEVFWRAYFDLERDYEAMFIPYESDEILSACRDAFRDIRVLRQPVWETICAFIISANNHQHRIQSIYLSMSEHLGEKMQIRGETVYSFPKPEQIVQAGESYLRSLRIGYRAPYLMQTAQMVMDGFSLAMDTMTYPQALTHLTRLAGVGEKVADCVLLFSGSHGCAFPVDVWIDRVMRIHYGMEGTRSAIKKQAIEHFGENAGYIQQYLFHGARTGIIGFP